MMSNIKDNTDEQLMENAIVFEIIKHLAKPFIVLFQNKFVFTLILFCILNEINSKLFIEDVLQVINNLETTNII